MLNLYYIADMEAFEAHANHFDPQMGAHYITLPTGRVLVSAHFPAGHGSQEMWEAREGVDALPHPVFEGTKQLPASCITHLYHLGIRPEHTILNVANAAGALHPLMKLRSF